MSEQIITNQIEGTSSIKAKKPSVPGTLMNQNPSHHRAYIPAGYGGVTMLEEKLRISEARVAELTKENNLLKKV